MEQIVIKAKNQTIHMVAGGLILAATLWTFVQEADYLFNYYRPMISNIMGIVPILLFMGGSICFFLTSKLNHPKAAFLPVAICFAASMFPYIFNNLYYFIIRWSGRPAQVIFALAVIATLVLYMLDKVPAVVPAAAVGVFIIGIFILYCVQVLPRGYVTFGRLLSGWLPEILQTAGIMLALLNLEKEKVSLTSLYSPVTPFAPVNGVYGQQPGGGQPGAGQPSGMGQPLSNAQQSAVPQQAAPQQNGAQPGAQQPNGSMPGGNVPPMDYRMMELAQEGNIVLNIVLSFLTFGIYLIFWVYSMARKIKLMNGENPDVGLELVCIFLVPFYQLYWIITRTQKMARNASQYGAAIGDNSVVYLILSFFGLSLIAYALLQNDLNTVSRSIQGQTQYTNTSF